MVAVTSTKAIAAPANCQPVNPAPTVTVRRGDHGVNAASITEIVPAKVFTMKTRLSSALTMGPRHNLAVANISNIVTEEFAFIIGFAQ